MFSNSFAGTAPSSAPVFIASQVGGGIAGVLLIRFLYPALTPAQAADAVVPHETGDSRKVWVTGPGSEPWEVYVVKGGADTLDKARTQPAAPRSRQNRGHAGSRVLLT